MYISKPIWNSNLAGLLIRVPLGLYFFYAGYVKTLHMESFIEGVKLYKILPDNLAVLYGVLLPYFEIGVGGLLVLGMWTTLASIVGSLLLISFIFALGLIPYPNNPYLFNKDVILLGAALSLLSSGPGAFSIDVFRKSG